MFTKDLKVIFKKRSEKWYLDLQNYSSQQLYYKPSSDQWCLAELYDHIIRVTTTYQIPNFYRCIGLDIEKGKPKNGIAYLIFNANIIPYRTIKMESFPSNIVSDFTPEILEREVLEQKFKNFIEQIIAKEPLLKQSNKKVKHNHPFFGMINAREWFSLVEIHIRHHERQKKRLEATSTD